MPIELLTVNADGCSNTPPNYEFFTIIPSIDEIPELWNGNPKILDAGVVVFICQSGKGKLVIDMHTFTIRRGSFCLLLPYTVIQILEYTEDIQVIAITAGVDFLEKLTLLHPVEDYVSLIQENPCLTLTDEELQEVKEIYQFTNNRLADKNRPFALEIRETLSTFLALEIVSAYARFKPTEKRKLSRQEQIFRNFTYSLSKNCRKHREVEYYAEEAYLTPRHFSDVIKKKSGKLPTQWIAERTITLIKFMLENSNMSMQEISDEMNFPTQSFFSRYFKKHTGMTPKEYRTKDI
ncbi:MAG: helix-turn-helix domain-containing protein [Bacteroides sp.]|nr:helix-turn-helix domain-containing protein [Bacteroides sp.]